MQTIRRRRQPEPVLTPNPNPTQFQPEDTKKTQKPGTEKTGQWNCINSCCWAIGVICTTWWVLLFMYNMMPSSIPQYVTEAITGGAVESPGDRMKKEGARGVHPVVLVPGIVTGGLELWEGKQCADGLFRKRLWGGTFGEVYKRPSCWVEHMSLNNETGLDPPGIRVRPVSGLVAADYFAAGYFVWAVLIANLAQIGYEDKNMYMAAYDWRLSFQNTEGAVKGSSTANTTCRDVWTEYHDMGVSGIKAVADYKVYTTGDVLELLHFVAPKMMARGDAHFSYGIADDLRDPKYQHYRYWSNPLETQLPNAPEMEIFSLYGVGLNTERAYVYRLAPSADCTIPFQIDITADSEDEHGCLKDGVFHINGDETVPVLSAGFMCAKGWRGRTRFNPSGIKTYIREYNHSPPANLLEGRGTQSGNHVDIMGNFALIEDIMRVAAGVSGEDLGGDRVYSDIFRWSEKINLKL